MEEILTVDEGMRWLTDGVPPYVSDSHDMRLSRIGSMDRYLARRPWTANLSYAIPCREVIEILTKERLVEVGAGTGYWSALIRNAGGDIVATDEAELENGYGQIVGRFHAVESLSATDAVIRYKDRDVLMIWPTYDANWAYKCARAMQANRILHVIGEDYGGCTADDAFYDLINREFDEIETLPIPQWEGVHDYYNSYRKRQLLLE